MDGPAEGRMRSPKLKVQELRRRVAFRTGLTGGARNLVEDPSEEGRVARRLRPEADALEEGTVGDDAAPSLARGCAAEEVLVARQALEDVAEDVVRDLTAGAVYARIGHRSPLRMDGSICV